MKIFISATMMIICANIIWMILLDAVYYIISPIAYTLVIMFTMMTAWAFGRICFHIARWLDKKTKT